MEDVLSQTETEFLIVRQSGIHGTGCFARKDIPAGTRVIEYVGEKITKEEALRQCELDNVYIFGLDEDFDINGNVPWNPARFINHSCEPNCEAEEDEGRIWTVAMRDIRAGEELSYNYGYDMEDYKDHPCRCGTTACTGFIVDDEHFEEVRRQRENIVAPGE